MSKWSSNEEIQIFRQYLRIPTVQPDVDYSSCVDFLVKQADNLGLPVVVYYPGAPNKPIVVITWQGQQPELPSIMLNSHMDVVPVCREKWTHPPFAAEMDEEGRIFARGTQDMKSVGMQYLGAIRALKRKGVTLKRTIHVAFVPDEEISGILGMKCFIPTNDFQKLNVGLCLDEGAADESDEYIFYYAEKTIWYVHFVINGTSGHGSLLHKNTAGQKLQYILNKMMAFRQDSVQRLEIDRSLSIGDVNTANLTVIKGGEESNVVPPVIEVVFDLRLTISTDLDALEKQFHAWCEEAGGNIDIVFETKDAKIPPTFAVDNTNPFWVGIKTAMEKLNLKVRSAIFPGVTDNRFVRQANIPALNFSPMANTPVLLHGNDECLKADTYLKGIMIYENILPAIANI